MPSQLFSIPPNEMQRLFDTSDGMSDVLKKLGYSPYGGDHPTLYRYIDQFDIDLTKLEENRSKKQSKQIGNKKSLEDVFSGKVEYSNSNHLRIRLIEEGYKEHKCEICGRTEWLGQPIPLELDHIDGDHSNNKLENLRVLCPNCHACSDHYCGRNTGRYKKAQKKEKIKKIIMAQQKVKDLDCHNRTYEERGRSPGKQILKDELRVNSFSAIGRKYGVSDNAVRRWCDHYGLPRHSKIINNMTNEEWSQL